MTEPITEQDFELLSKCLLFKGMTYDEKSGILAMLNARKCSFPKGSLVQRLGEPFCYAGVVADGVLAGSFITEKYDNIELGRFQQGDTYGVTTAMKQLKRSPIQFAAATDVVVIRFDPRLPVSYDNNEVSAKYHNNMVQMLIEQNMFLRKRVIVMGQGSIRNRLLCYLAELSTDKDNYVHVPLSRVELAGFLGVNRSALSREITHMVSDGILETRGSRFRIVR